MVNELEAEKGMDFRKCRCFWSYAAADYSSQLMRFKTSS